MENGRVDSPLTVDADRPGLRERKKAKTRALIQQVALRLIREQGYDATTVEQIADAAEVSPSTFFRYFPAKEDVVIYDALDPLVVEAFLAQPADASPIAAARAAMHSVFGALNQEQRDEQRERSVLAFAVPELQAALIRQVMETGRWFGEAIAERVSRPPDDLAVRVFVGAMTGALLAALIPAVDDPEADWVALMDRAFDLVEAGLPL